MPKRIVKIQCRDCRNLFNPENKIKRGFIDQCNSCSEDDVEKYLGRPGASSKSGSIEIFRTNLGFVKQVLKREGKIGFTANISLGNPARSIPERDSD